MLYEEKTRLDRTAMRQMDNEDMITVSVVGKCGLRQSGVLFAVRNVVRRIRSVVELVRPRNVDAKFSGKKRQHL